MDLPFVPLSQTLPKTVVFTVVCPTGFGKAVAMGTDSHSRWNVEECGP